VTVIYFTVASNVRPEGENSCHASRSPSGMTI